MLASAVAAGRSALDHAHSLTDSDGKTVREELIRIGSDGPAREGRPIPYACIECHIQQGPILDDAGVGIGIGIGRASISWQRLAIRGEAAHAGTTSSGSRHDAWPRP
jgi:N-carbamoyl-L-amino-acid hydrolase